MWWHHVMSSLQLNVGCNFTYVTNGILVVNIGHNFTLITNWNISSSVYDINRLVFHLGKTPKPPPIGGETKKNFTNSTFPNVKEPLTKTLIQK